MRVLVVDDDPVAARVVGEAVRRFGYAVQVCLDAASAWKTLESEAIPIVLTDWHMPGEDGVSLCRRIRSNQLAYYTYVIFVTSRSQHEDLVHALSVGADDLIAKPFDPEELRARLMVAERIVNLESRLRDAADELRQRNEDLDQKSKIDSLMGIGNRSAFDSRIREVHAHAAASGGCYGLVMCDVDHFKRYNDTFGHQGGDEILRRVADAVQVGIRSGDSQYRYGGEEIMIVLPDLDLAGAKRVAERVRRQVAGAEFVLENVDLPFRVTVSCGVASFPDRAQLREGYVEVIERADLAMYHAKRTGRNRVVGSDEWRPAPIPAEPPPEDNPGDWSPYLPARR